LGGRTTISLREDQGIPSVSTRVSSFKGREPVQDVHCRTRTACQYDIIKHMLLKPILSGRIGKWAYALVEYDLAYEPLRSMKGQVVADFIVDHAVEVDNPVSFVQLTLWGLYFDGPVSSKGQGAGCVIVSPSGVIIDLSIRLEFACTNNQVEYESLLHGLEYLRDLGQGTWMCLEILI
jgi:hypothetical protein